MSDYQEKKRKRRQRIKNKLAKRRTEIAEAVYDKLLERGHNAILDKNSVSIEKDGYEITVLTTYAGSKFGWKPDDYDVKIHAGTGMDYSRRFYEKKKDVIKHRLNKIADACESHLRQEISQRERKSAKRRHYDKGEEFIETYLDEDPLGSFRECGVEVTASFMPYTEAGVEVKASNFVPVETEEDREQARDFVIELMQLIKKYVPKRADDEIPELPIKHDE